MNELSLFTGGGGGVLGTTLLGFNHIGYVEWTEYCQKELAQRIKDGFIKEAPIFSDIDSFIGEGYAESYKGLVDVITAGFPCQPFSVAGKGLAESDPRNKWPQTIRAIGIIRPPFAFLENVPGLFAHKYIQRIFGDMAEIGYDCRWCPVSASDAGAPHGRKRQWFLMADSEEKHVPRKVQEPGELSGSGPKRVQDRGCCGGKGIWWSIDPAELGDSEIDTERPGLCEEESGEERGGRSGDASEQNPISDTEGKTPVRGNGKLSENTSPQCPGEGEESNGGWGTIKPGLGELADGLADWMGFIEAAFGGKIPRVATGIQKRLDRLKVLGNGQVPASVVIAWEILNGVVE